MKRTRLIYSTNREYVGEVSRYNVLNKITDEDSGISYLETQNQTKIPENIGDMYHTVSVGEENRLDIIANNYYNDPTMWWAIAMANELIDPFVIRVGTTLRIPSVSTLNLQSNGILNR